MESYPRWQKYFEKGIIIRVGDGVTTNIWDHNWIPTEGLMRHVSSLVQNPPQLVPDLIDPSSAVWREDRIQEVFVPFDAKAILKIPLCTRHVEDFWAWREDSRGMFTVRSAYKMLIKIKLGREGWLEENEGSSNSEGESKGWTSLWKTQVPSKLHVFTWWLAQHSLPTSDLLHYRNSQRRVCVHSVEHRTAGDILC